MAAPPALPRSTGNSVTTALMIMVAVAAAPDPLGNTDRSIRKDQTPRVVMGTSGEERWWEGLGEELQVDLESLDEHESQAR